MKNLWRLLTAGVVITIISEILHMADGFLGMKYYIDPQYFSVWSKIMMPNAGPPPASFFYLSAAFSFVMAIIFVLVYLALHKGIHVTGRAAKGAYFGLLIFLIAGISGALAMYLMFNLPVMLIGLWTAEDLVIKVLGGMVVAGLIKS